MRHSPLFSNNVSPTGAPPMSPKSARAVGIMQAVTLACTAAFAATSTSLLFVLFLSGQSNNGNFLGIGQFPHPPDRVKCDNTLSEQPPLINGKGIAPEKAPPDRAYAFDPNRAVADTSKDRFNHRRSILSSSPIDPTASKWPTGIIWLMSFPNSGTSYTIHMVRELTNTTTATNYGLEGDIKDEPSVPAFENDANGPYLELIPSRHTNIPKLILTKTHCGGFSTSVKPASFIETPRSFMKACLKGKRGVYSSDSKKSLTTQKVWYSHERVHKIVHIFRSPLDNVVARFHLERKRFTAKNDKKWLSRFPNNKDGFRKWCKSIDDSPTLVNSRWIDRDLRDAFVGVPCHAEFYRFVQWHNYAMNLARDLDLPTMIFHYEDYSSRFDEVAGKLLTFLELVPAPASVPPEFIAGKKYEDHYTKEEIAAIAGLVKELSTKPTWSHLAQYFGESVSIAEKKI